MRIALCFSAHFRNYNNYLKNTYESIYKPFEQIGKVDIFISTWETLGPKYSWHTSHNGTGGLDKIFVDPRDILNKYRPVQMVIEKYEDIKPSLLLKNFTSKTPCAALYKEGICSTTPAFYKIWRCNELKTQYEVTHGFQYDVVVRLRPDINYSPLSPSKLDLKFLHVPYVSYDQCYDHFAISNSENMDKYSECFLRLRKIYENDFDLGGERTLKIHTKNINVPTFPIEGLKIWK